MISTLLISIFLRLIQGSGARDVFVFRLPACQVPSVEGVTLNLCSETAVFLGQINNVVITLSVLL